MLKIFEIIIMVPLALIGFFMILELITKVLGEPTVDEEWQDIHGQGPFKEEN